jgi:hypothetical protein
MNAKTLSLVVVGASVLFALSACRHTPPPALAGAAPGRGAGAGGDPELELQKLAAAWPQATDVSLLTLAAHYAPAGRDREAHEFFQAQAAAHPKRGLQPYLLMRENVIARLQREHTGYWQPDGAGLRPHTRAAWAGALDLLAGGDEGRFRKVTEQLLARNQLALALDVAEAGLAAHPASRGLREARALALDRLREKYQGTNPFKFIVYSELAGAELPPVDAAGARGR